MSKDNAADYFSRHKGNDECHITSDNRVFHTKGAADGFAGSLKDSTVTSYKRSEFEDKAELESTDEGEKEARFKQRVDVLIGLGFERIEDDFINSETNSSISAADVLESSDEEFEVSITPIVMEPTPEAPKGDSPKLDSNIQNDGSKPDPLELLKAFDPETATYEDAKALVKLLGIETPNKKQPVLLAAIANYKIINHEVKI